VSNPDSLPVDEGDLLTTLNSFVGSVNKPALQTLIQQLGVMFTGTGTPLQQIIDEGGKFIDTASAHTDDTIRLLDAAESVLTTQQQHGSDITTFAHQLSLLTSTLRHSDGDLRTVLDQTPDTAAQIQGLLKDLEPTLPVLLSDLVNVNSVVVSHLSGLEQLLVTFPRVIAGGFTGTTPDGYGHVNLQLDESQAPCTQGYKPVSQWRGPNDLTDSAIYPAHCTAGPPFVMRGADHVPGTPGNPSVGRTYSGTYDPRTGVVGGVVDKDGKPVRVADPGDLSIMGDDSWKWLVVGPVTSP
jgi:phospholipid/cholesterol/gamma-HCH transport system substrate-binding protein